MGSFISFTTPETRQPSPRTVWIEFRKLIPTGPLSKLSWPLTSQIGTRSITCRRVRLIDRDEAKHLSGIDVGVAFAGAVTAPVKGTAIRPPEHVFALLAQEVASDIHRFSEHSRR